MKRSARSAVKKSFQKQKFLRSKYGREMLTPSFPMAAKNRIRFQILLNLILPHFSGERT
jgi:hypothetical protein